MKTLLNKRLVPWSYLATLATVHFIFFMLFVISVFELSFNEMLAVQGASVLLMFISAGILFIKNNGSAAAQTFRLLTLTVTQLLGYLSTSLALIYTNQSVELVLYLLSLSLSVLILQTSYLVRRLK